MVHTALRHRAVRTALLTAAAGLVAAGLVAPLQATAQNGSPEPEPDPCEGAVTLSEADRLAGNCLPGNDVARLLQESAVPDLDVDEEASSENVTRLANIPKQGAFAPEDALGSDLAFQGDYAFAGNYNGFTVYDISTPSQPEVVTQVVCPGAQNDVSVHGDVLVLSTDAPRSDDSCNSEADSATNAEAWEGIRVFDISDVRRPEYVAAVATPCGSHTHSIAPGTRGKPGQGKGQGPKPKDLYVYVSSYAPDESFPNCQPPHDLISIVKVPLKKPQNAELIATPVLFPDGGNPGGGYSRETSGCHDLTAYPTKDIMAGACMGDGIMLDITDRENPVVTEQVRDEENFAFWHSATFNNEASKVVFTDELGGGGAPTCNEEIGDTKGANGIYDLTRDGSLEFKSYYKIPRVQSNTENCVAHNGSLVPVKDKDIMVQAWYQGGWSMFDFTDSENPEEIAWHDRGPVDDERLVTGGPWSTYYYNGHVYSNEIQRGFDVFRVDDRRIKGAEKVTFDELNPQSQPSYTARR
ncbi:LVIVD repeat-containing protein [Aeromicrobium sp. CTD01-1L150]|uniref:LVIVD repeat-containing protein n=1 Tax=Aeromicrobium sp. CTD01-1L150 TaxID=3341830 RepID=UPI0035C1FF37